VVSGKAASEVELVIERVMLVLRRTYVVVEGIAVAGGEGGVLNGRSSVRTLSFKTRPFEPL
jgi:hypothetical protein